MLQACITRPYINNCKKKKILNSIFYYAKPFQINAKLLKLKILNIKKYSL